MSEEPKLTKKHPRKKRRRAGGAFRISGFSRVIRF